MRKEKKPKMSDQNVYLKKLEKKSKLNTKIVNKKQRIMKEKLLKLKTYRRKNNTKKLFF